MSTKRDYYEILKVHREASATEIKQAYRRLARKHHPDVNGGDSAAEEQFKEINEAYECLCNPEKRRMYDQFGHEGMSGGSSSGFDFEGFGGFGDIFDAFFGGGPRGQRRPMGEQGSDLRYDLEISLEEVATGVERTLRISKLHACETCNGSGARPGSSPETCLQCHGTGQVRQNRQTFLGSFSTVAACPIWQGRGYVIVNPCGDCGGSGRVRKTAEQTVHIPAGVEHGMRVRLRGEGDAGARGGPAGDLYIMVYVRPHESFERHGDSIMLELPISFVQAALGDVIEVPTLDGPEKVNIPPGTQAGTVFTLKGKGLPNLNTGSRGNQDVVARIMTPTKLSDEQKTMLIEFAKTMGEEPHPGKGFIGKLLGK
ncbi:MAG: molecular chaperone DnaJ [Armatimonadota bacterium]